MKILLASVLIQLGTLTTFMSTYVTMRKLRTSSVTTEINKVSAHSKSTCCSSDTKRKSSPSESYSKSTSGGFAAPSDVNVTLLPNATVKVDWNFVMPPNHSIEYFVIEYLKLDKKHKEICRCKLWHRYTDDMTNPYSFWADCLEPNYDYRFRVAAAYDEKNVVYCHKESRLMKLRMKIITTTPLTKKLRRIRKRRGTTIIPGLSITPKDPRLGKVYEEGSYPPPTWPPDDVETETSHVTSETPSTTTISN
nr:PREDICTED: uncharacterized protein LOC109038286 [Bemisia tabaci]